MIFPEADGGRCGGVTGEAGPLSSQKVVNQEDTGASQDLLPKSRGKSNKLCKLQSGSGGRLQPSTVECSFLPPSLCGDSGV